MYLPHHITCLGAVNIRRARSIAGLGVGMANGEIRIYNEKALVRCAVVSCVIVCCTHAFAARFA